MTELRIWSLSGCFQVTCAYQALDVGLTEDRMILQLEAILASPLPICSFPACILFYFGGLV
jgi:hypothetical protein